MPNIPRDLPARLQFYGRKIFGKCWKGPMAQGLGVDRSTLRLWLRGEYKSGRDIDGELIELIDRERDANAERSIELGELRKSVIKTSDRERYHAL